MEGFTTQEDQEMLSRIEKQLKRRFAIGSQVSEHSIIQDFVKQVSGLDTWGEGETGHFMVILGQTYKTWDISRPVQSAGHLKSICGAVSGNQQFLFQVLHVEPQILL